MEDALRRHVGVGAPAWLWRGPFEQAVEAAGGSRRVAALRRLQFGAALEENLAALCDGLCPVEERARVCQLHFDAYAVAVWASAHAEYVVALDAGCEEPAAPSIGTFPCASVGIDLSDLFARRSNPKEAGVPKHAEPLVQLLGRCTNPGARGWDSVLQSALDTDGVRTIVHDSIKVCLTGMHPQLRPSLRPPWQERLCILRVSQTLLADRLDLVSHAAAYIKEAMRRTLASTLACDAATHAALASLGHPVRHLHQPPVQMPHTGMAAAMAAFARAGAALVTEEGAQRKLSATLRSAFTATDGSDEAEPTCSTAACDAPTGLAWEQSWLGAPHTHQPVIP